MEEFPGGLGAKAELNQETLEARSPAAAGAVKWRLRNISLQF